ncbi:MAG: ABC transporter permease [Deltaproteobacteria bacterium]|nr:ABC transporter permease [Deltaproteobacteria bacterium]MBT4263041.1 ABC transporter permease [Deltaproteobacteria bacterium]MBT4640533.1 ABC transporter permease [Deltaproteobacteria bacterium]MBT6499157.1 ABC transporter permease [Deltaproteobacteria bacterium]MBT6612240.1 ABC transporter permease [Deltaproteobacteria bacterium]
MERYILKRVGQALICLLGITIIIFLLTRISGDPVSLMVPPEATLKDIQAMRTSLGLDRPLYVQYWEYISGLMQGDFGNSIRWGTPCLDIFMERFPNTIILSIAAMVFAVFVGIPVGILSAVYVERWFDKTGKIFALIGQSLPVFWLGIMLMMIFSVNLGMLPTSGMGGWLHLIMPTITLGWYATASFTRLTRSSMLEVLDAEYIKMARIVGVSEFMVVWKNALKNAVLPILTLGMANFIALLNGAVITETVFNWPGVGRLVVDAVFTRDFPLVQTCVILASALFIFANLFVDILYAYLDPRIRYQ